MQCKWVQAQKSNFFFLPENKAVEGLLVRRKSYKFRSFFSMKKKGLESAISRIKHQGQSGYGNHIFTFFGLNLSKILYSDVLFITHSSFM